MKASMVVQIRCRRMWLLGLCGRILPLLVFLGVPMPVVARLINRVVLPLVSVRWRVAGSGRWEWLRLSQVGHVTFTPTEDGEAFQA